MPQQHGEANCGLYVIIAFSAYICDFLGRHDKQKFVKMLNLCNPNDPSHFRKVLLEILFELHFPDRNCILDDPSRALDDEAEANKIPTKTCKKRNRLGYKTFNAPLAEQM